MKRIMVFTWLIMAPVVIFAASVKKDLLEAINDKSVKMDAANFTGTYEGKTTRLTITNNTKSVLQLKVNLGMILKPEDDGYQPMVLAGEEMLVVMPGKEGKVDVQTFCGNSPKHCPRKEAKYSFSRMGSDTLIKVLRFINTNSIFDYLGQSAVWVITNQHPLSDIYSSENRELSEKLIALVASVTGRPKPEYYTLVRPVQIPDAPAYVPKVLQIIANFEVRLETPKVLTLGVFNEQGVMIQKVFENQEFAALGHRFEVEFESQDVPAGKYFIRLKEGDAIVQEKMVNVE